MISRSSLIGLTKVQLHIKNQTLSNYISCLSGKANGGGYVDGGSVVDYNISAIANEGYEFSHWETTDPTVTFSSEFSDFSKITFEAKDNILIKAVFTKSPQTFNLLLSSSNENWGVFPVQEVTWKAVM